MPREAVRGRSGPPPRVIILIFCLLVAGVMQAVSASSPSANATRPDILFVTAPAVSSGTMAHRFPRGSSLVRLNIGEHSPKPIHLTPGFFAVADPEISFDASHVLFSGKKTAGSWQIWEMGTDGSSPRQITHCSGDCLRAAYLPDDEIVYTAFADSGSYLAVSKLDGSQAHAISFGPGNFQVETVLQDGRILASANAPLTAIRTRARVLYTLRPDGTGLDPFRSQNPLTSIEHEATELDEGDVVFISSISQEQPGGTLEEIQRGAIGDSKLAAVGAFSSPRQLATDKLIVSRLSPTSAHAGQARHFDLYAFRLESRTFGELIYADTDGSSVQPVVIAPHSMPKKFWSLVNPEATAGNFICLDSYLTADRASRKFREKIAQVRVIRFDLRTNTEESLGDAPVESDGSFYIAVPPDQPVRFELLDPNGHLIHAQQGWVWSRPGEERGCAGCHEDRAIAPENRWPLTLKRFDTPTPMGVKDNAAKQ